MAGSVNKDNNTGKWYYILELGKDENGKRKQKKKRGFKTKREAQQALVSAENEFIQGTFIEPTKLLLKDFWNEWFKVKRNTLGIQTQVVYERIIRNHLIPSFGTVTVSNLKAIHIQKFINNLVEKDYAPETIKKIYNVLRSSLVYARDMEIILNNCADKIKVPTQGRRKKIIVWDENEIKQFLRVSIGDRYFMVFHLALMTGMRQGEILGLKWKDVDLEDGSIKISQTLSHDGKLFLEGAKTKAGIRTIPLPDKTIKRLKKHKSIIIKEREELGEGYTDNDLVICTILGTPLTPANLRRTFNRLIKGADLPRISFHDLRHTHATWLLSKGVNVKVISERLGHSNIKITLDIYSHILPTMQQEAVNKLNTMLG